MAHPIFQRIKDEWLGQLLTAVNVGDIATYERVMSENKAAITAQPVLVDAAQTLREKVSILALMMLALGRSARERTLTFADIAKATKLAQDEVELLLMKALSLDLIRGNIDELEQTIAVSWVQPRVLDAAQIGALCHSAALFSLQTNVKMQN